MLCHQVQRLDGDTSGFRHGSCVDRPREKKKTEFRGVASSEKTPLPAPRGLQPILTLVARPVTFCDRICAF